MKKYTWVILIDLHKAIFRRDNSGMLRTQRVVKELCLESGHVCAKTTKPGYNEIGEFCKS